MLKRNVLELTVKHVDSLTLIGWCRPRANVTLKAHSAHSNRLLNTPVARLMGTLMPAKDPWTARDRRLRQTKVFGFRGSMVARKPAGESVVAIPLGTILLSGYVE